MLYLIVEKINVWIFLLKFNILFEVFGWLLLFCWVVKYILKIKKVKVIKFIIKFFVFVYLWKKIVFVMVLIINCILVEIGKLIEMFIYFMLWNCWFCFKF